MSLKIKKTFVTSDEREFNKRDEAVAHQRKMDFDNCLVSIMAAWKKPLNKDDRVLIKEFFKENMEEIYQEIVKIRRIK